MTCYQDRRFVFQIYVYVSLIYSYSRSKRRWFRRVCWYCLSLSPDSRLPHTFTPAIFTFLLHVKKKENRYLVIKSFNINIHLTFPSFNFIRSSNLLLLINLLILVLNLIHLVLKPPIFFLNLLELVLNSMVFDL